MRLIFQCNGFKGQGYLTIFIPFLIFVYRWFWLMKLRKYQNIAICLFTFYSLSLQTKIIIKKITQPKLPKTKNEVTKICNELGINWFQILSNINSAVLLYITLLQIHFEHKGENVPNFDWTWILVSNYFLCLIIGYCRIVLQRKCDHAMKLIIILYITSVQVGSW